MEKASPKGSLVGRISAETTRESRVTSPKKAESAVETTQRVASRLRCCRCGCTDRRSSAFAMCVEGAMWLQKRVARLSVSEQTTTATNAHSQ